jgi:hypothetical protein
MVSLSVAGRVIKAAADNWTRVAQVSPAIFADGSPGREFLRTIRQ